MTPDAAAQVLAVAQAFDSRTVSRTTALAWADALDGIDPTDAAHAVREHYRTRTDFVMPAHVRQIVETARRAAQDAADRDRRLARSGGTCGRPGCPCPHTTCTKGQTTTTRTKTYSFGRLGTRTLAVTSPCPTCTDRDQP